MKWRNWTVLVLWIGMSAAIGQAAHALDGQPSRSALQEMGLGGLAVMSDDDALAVRGQGFSPGNGGGSSAMASGSSFATVNTPFGSAHSENAYSSKGKHKAGGDNFSFAGFAATTSRDKSGHGDKGGKPNNGCKVSRSCNSPPPSHGNCDSSSRPSHGGMGGGKGGMGTTTTSFVVFAGGFSHAFAH